MSRKVKPGMSAQEIATLHYELLLAGDKKEWIKTIQKSMQNNVDSRGASPFYWWSTGRRYQEQYGYSYTFKHKDERQSSETYIKLFFHRLNKEGNPQGQVPIHLIKDAEDNNEWRVKVSSW